MKWILAILLLISASAIGQVEDSTKYVWYRFQYGQRLPRGWWDSIAHMPYYDTAGVRPARPGAIMMRPADKKFYTWDGTNWVLVGGTSTTLNNLGTGFRWVATPSGDIKTVENTATVEWDSTANSLSASVPDNAITNANLAQAPAFSVKGNAFNTTDNVGDILALNDHSVLRRNGTSINFGAINLASPQAVTGVLRYDNLDTSSANHLVTQSDLNDATTGIGPPSLTYKNVGFGGVGGKLSPGEAAFNYDSITNKLSVDTLLSKNVIADTFKIAVSPQLQDDTLLTRRSNGVVGKTWNLGVTHQNNGIDANRSTVWSGNGKWEPTGTHTFFKVGESSFPANNDSVYTNSSLAGYTYYGVYREGVMQYMDTTDGVQIDTATGTFTAHPPFVTGERVHITASKWVPLRSQPFTQFNVLTVNNLRSWYDATDPTTITVSTGVSTWADKGPNHLNLSAIGGSGGQPAYVSTGGSNNQAYVSFTPGKRMSVSFPQDSGQVTGYMVIQNPTWVADSRLFVYDNVNVGGGAGLFTPSSLSTYNGYFGYDGVGAGIQELNTETSNWILLTFKFRGNAAYSIKINKLGGSIYGYEKPGAGTPSTLRNNVTYLNFFNNASFKLSEFILVKGEPSVGDETNIKNYLMSKYAITQKPSILFFGDSHTGGIMSGTPTGLPYYILTSKEKGYDFMNYAATGSVVYPISPYGGISNFNLQNLYNQFDQVIQTNNPIIALQYGTNDGTSPSNSAWQTAYKAYIQHLIDLGVPQNRIILCSPPYSTGSYAGNLAAAMPYIAQIATDMGIQYCDFYHYTQSLGLDCGTVPGGDGIHGNGPIHRAMADLLKTFLP